MVQQQQPPKLLLDLSVGQWEEEDWIFVVQQLEVTAPLALNKKKKIHIGGGNVYPDIKELLKTAIGDVVPGAKLVSIALLPNREAADDYWIVPLESYNRLLESLEGKKEHITCTKIPQKVFDMLAFPASSSSASSSSSTDITTEDCYQKLYPFQKESVEFIVKQQGRGIIGDEMGLGKTIQGITLMKHYNVSTLLICPSSLSLNWKEQYAHFSRDDTEEAAEEAPENMEEDTEEEDMENVEGDTKDDQKRKNKCRKERTKQQRRKEREQKQRLKQEKQEMRERKRQEEAIEGLPGNDNLYIMKDGDQQFRHNTIISFSLLTSKKVVSRIPEYEMLLIDESHALKTSASQRTKVVLKLAKKAKYVVLLTGTPSSRTKELYSQMRMISPFLLKSDSFWPYQNHIVKGAFYFAERYCDPHPVPYFRGKGARPYNFTGTCRSWEANAVLNHYMVRHTKTKVLKDMPPKYRQKMILENLNADQKQWFQDELAAIETIRKNKSSKMADFKLMELVRTTAEKKQKFILQYVQHLIRSLDDNDDKYLLFCHHKTIFASLTELLTNHEKPFIAINSQVHRDLRQPLVHKFQEDASIRFAVLGIQSAGTGLNLFKANRVVFLELLWNPDQMLQSEDRAHRIGQTRPVTVDYVILGGSTDDLMWRSLNRKVSSTGAVLDNTRTYLRAKKETITVGEDEEEEGDEDGEPTAKRMKM